MGDPALRKVLPVIRRWLAGGSDLFITLASAPLGSRTVQAVHRQIIVIILSLFATSGDIEKKA